MKIPKQYEKDSVEAMLDNAIMGTFDDGWNDQGTPADFVFDDGVKLNYDEVWINDSEEFAGHYEEQVGYRFHSGSAEEIYADEEGSGSPFLFTFVLDFSDKPELLRSRKDSATVTVTYLQAGGGGPIAGNVIISKGLDKKKLHAWIKNVIDSDKKVARA
jgi:hypothetical protein